MDSRILSPWIIFKGKQQLKAQWKAMKQEGQGGHTALSENGWTDNELGLKWLQECFEPETRL